MADRHPHWMPLVLGLALCLVWQTAPQVSAAPPAAAALHPPTYMASQLKDAASLHVDARHVLADGEAAVEAVDADSLRAPPAFDRAARKEVAALSRATTANDRLGNKRFDDLDRAYSDAPAGARLPVIVSFTAQTSTSAGLNRVRDIVPDAPIRQTYTLIPAYAGALTDAESLRVAALPEVRQIELDRQGIPLLESSRSVMGVDAVIDELDITGSLDGMPDVATTEDVVIAVIDSGIHEEHVDLAGKLVAWQDFGTRDPEPRDSSGHGTHVASIAAGWGNADPAMRGVAPGAGLIGIKISGGPSMSAAMSAYAWIVEHREEHNIRIATISWGFGAATDGTTALERLIDAAWDAGIVAFNAGGNSGPGLQSMRVPSAARGILSIGSVLAPHGAGHQRLACGPSPETCTSMPGDKHGFLLSEFSSRGPTTDGRVKPDLVAPGETIRAADMNRDGYVTYSGTSMAAPFAAGIGGLMLTAAPSLQPDEVRDLLLDTAEDRGAPGPDNDFGHGRIQAWSAVVAALENNGKQAGADDTTNTPTQESFQGVADSGTFEVEFSIDDTGFPVAATVLADERVIAVDVLDSTGLTVAQHPGHIPNRRGRQHHLSFEPSGTATYLLRAVVPPGGEVIVDLSHSSEVKQAGTRAAVVLPLSTNKSDR